MTRAAIRLNSKQSRQDAARACWMAPVGSTMEIKTDTRNTDQNRLMWALLTDVARQVVWPPESGMKLTPDDWKLIFMDALNQEMRLVPNASMNGYVNLGRSTSRLSKSEFSDLLELIRAFGAKHEVRFNEHIEEDA